MSMIPALAILYILLLGVGVACSHWSYRLGQKYGHPFLRPYYIFVLLSLAYAAMNFIGEVFAPALLTGQAESMTRVYLIVDLVTIPLVGALFFLFFLWITRLLGRQIAPGFKVAFLCIEALFLAAFIISFISYFVRGISTWSYVGFYVLNGIIGILAIAAVLLLFFVAPTGGGPNRRRLARGLGVAYSVSLAILVVFLLASRTPLFRDPAIARVIPCGFIFLINLPALFYLQRSLRTWPLLYDQASSAAK